MLGFVVTLPEGFQEIALLLGMRGEKFGPPHDTTPA